MTLVTKRIPRSVTRTALYANDYRNLKDIRFYVSRFVSQNSFFVDRLSTAMNFRSRTYDMKIFLGEVIKQAEGNFLFVKMTLQYLNDTDGIVGLQVLPTSLFDLYNIFFERQFGRDGFAPFRSLFEILISVCSPLQLNNVEEILKSEYEEEDVFQLIEQASCFLRFGHDGTVRIYHQSFAEWLINQSAVIHINETRAHQNIATFQIRRISERYEHATFEEVIELFMHILAGNTLEKHRNTLDLFNITEMREAQTKQTILHHLATKPKPFLPVLDFFVAKFKTVDILDTNKKTPAFYAASEGFVENLRRFISRGADVSSLLEGLSDEDPFSYAVGDAGIEEYSLIHAAAAKGHKDVVELLIDSNVNFDDVSKTYPTPLHLAAENGHVSVLQSFHDVGTKFDLITLHRGAARNRSDVVEFLLKTVGIRDSCLQCICKREDFALSKRSKLSVNVLHSCFCETALHAAVSRGYIDIVRILLEHGKESLECTTHHSGKTVLIDAVERNDTEMVDLLLENGANVSAQCGNKTSKQSSAGCSFYSTVIQEFLYTVYCTEDDSCECGNTAIHVSAKYGFWRVAERLVSKQVSDFTDVMNSCGEYALHVAISHGHTNFLYHANETCKKHGYFIVDSTIVRFAVMRHSDNAVRHFLSYPAINYIYYHTWELLLLSVDYSPHYTYVTGAPNPVYCPEIYEHENLSLGEWIQAVSKKNLAVIQLLIESYKSYEEKLFFLNKLDDEGLTLLHRAVKNGFEDAVKYLIESGADTQIINAEGDSLLTFALKLHRNTSANRDAWYRCYTTNDGEFSSCNTTSRDEIIRYLIWTERKYLSKCDDRSSFLLNKIIEKQMPLSLYELLKAGVDMNCQKDKSLPRPFLHHLRSRGRQLGDVFKIFEVDISIECGTSRMSSELHIISQHEIPDDLSNFFKPLGKHRSPMQRLIDKHPKGVGILDTCYEDDGFLPIHHAASGGNLAAVIWFKNIGANTQLKSRSGGTALDISIIKLKDESEAELLSSLKGTQSYRKAVFEELLQTFFSTRPDFLCNPSEERLSPLRRAAIQGTKITLIYVHKKASEIFRNSHIHCDDEHRIDTVYHAHFISLLQFGYTDQYWKEFGYTDQY
jgi:ankyrin repeat protein